MVLYPSDFLWEIQNKEKDMKKILSVCAAVATLAFSAAIISCGDTGDEYSAAQDTVLTLATPSVTAKAYPGYNLISWTPVSNVSASGYEVYRYENGNLTDATVVTSVTNTFYEDTKDLQNNVSYTYKVMARGSISSRSVYTKDSACGSATVKAIVPPLETSALNLAAYESGYDGTKTKELSTKETEKYLLTAESSELVSNGTELAVSVRAKAYLEYDVYTVLNETYSVLGTLPSASTLSSGEKSTIENNTVLPMRAAVTSAGDYVVYVKAKAKSPYFVNTDLVELGTVTYEALETSTDTVVTDASYTNGGSTIRVVFTPAVFANGATASVSNYKVYRSVQGSGSYTEVSATVTDAVSDAKADYKTTYYFDDTIEDNSVAYTYTLVLTDGTKLGTTPVTTDVAAYTSALSATPKVEDNSSSTATTIAYSVSALDTDALSNDITWTITLADTETSFKAYLLTKDSSYTGTPVASDFTSECTSTAATDTTGVVYTIYSKNITAYYKAYLLVVLSKTGYQNTYVISDPVTISVTSVAAPTLTSAQYDSSWTVTSTGTQAKNDVILNVTDSIDTETDAIGNYMYTLYRTTGTLNTTASPATLVWSANDSAWTSLGTITLSSNTAYDASATTINYVGVYKDNDLSDGVYAYKVVKASSSASASSDIVYEEITANEDVNGIVFVPATFAVTPTTTTTVSPATRTVEISFTKDDTENSLVYDSSDTFHHYPAGIVEESAEEGVTYSLYRATLAANSATTPATEIVYTQLALTPTVTQTTSTYQKFTVFDGSDTTGTETSYVDKLTYKFTDKDLPTGSGYDYYLVISKSGVKSKYVKVTTGNTVTGNN